MLKPSYEAGEDFSFVAKGVCRCVPSGSTVRHLAEVTQRQHPDVQITVNRKVPSVSISATGNLVAADRAVSSAARDFLAGVDLTGVRFFYGMPVPVPDWGNSFRCGLLGFLAAVGVALGFLVPPKSRLQRPD